jgi:hypothetical protein
MSLQPPIDYAPTPPTDRPHLVRQGKDFTLTLPPRLGWRTAAHLAVLGGTAALLFAMAAWPPGVTRIGSISTPGAIPLAPRVFLALVGLLALLAVVRTVRLCRTWTVIELHRGTLICRTPGLRALRVVRHPLRDFGDATVVLEDGSRSIRLRPHNDARATILLDNPGDAVYRTADLEFAAGRIREAIAAGTSGSGVTDVG